jgi:hypothetical protein
MFRFVLIVRLMTSEPPEMMLVEDCEVAHQWIKEAYAWAERSGIPPEDGPKYGCFAIDSRLAKVSK